MTDAHVGTDVTCEELLGHPCNEGWASRSWLRALKCGARSSSGLSKAGAAPGTWAAGGGGDGADEGLAGWFRMP